MREIKFRGKTANGEWFFGSLVYSENIQPAIYFEVGKGSIKTFDFVYVRPETVGQFTGLIDKNGNKIFEGDIISTDLARDFLVVEFKGGAFVFNCNDGEDDYYDHINASHELDDEYKYGDVIGNIHDNPELQEAGE